MLTKLGLALSAATLLVVMALAGTSASRAEACPGADNFQIVGQECLGTNNVRLQMQWTSYNLGAQWFDVSLQNNGWVWDTFVGAGPIASGQSTFVWDGFLPSARHYLRVNTLTTSGWFESPTVSFVTRGCAGGGGGVAPIGKVGPHCDGLTWCAGDPAPPQCKPNTTGALKGCLWTDRTAGSREYHRGEAVVICFWVDRPMQVRIESATTTATTTIFDAPDDGNGDCFRGVAGNTTGERLMNLYGNGQRLGGWGWTIVP